MPNNFSQFSFNVSGYQSIGPLQQALVAGAALADITVLDVTAIDHVNISFAVTGAPLNGFDILLRGDSSAEWQPIALSQIAAYGRSDAGTDVTTTPVGVTGFVRIATSGWSEIRLRAKSAGAALLSISAGGK